MVKFYTSLLVLYIVTANCFAIEPTHNTHNKYQEYINELNNIHDTIESNHRIINAAAWAYVMSGDMGFAPSFQLPYTKISTTPLSRGLPC